MNDPELLAFLEARVAELPDWDAAHCRVKIDYGLYLLEQIRKTPEWIPVGSQLAPWVYLADRWRDHPDFRRRWDTKLPPSARFDRPRTPVQLLEDEIHDLRRRVQALEEAATP